VRRVVVVLCCLLSPLALASCKSDGRTLRPPSSLDPKNGSISVPTTVTTIAGVPPVEQALDQAPPVIPFAVQTPWADGGTIDKQFTCAGADVSPAITWLSPPADAVELALIVEDPDANNFVHWVIAGLDPLNPALPEGSPPVGAIEGANSFSTAANPQVGWSGPCPPAGTTHTYRFTLYALDQQTELPTGTPAADLKAFIENASIEAAQITAKYTAS
jgi:Raf kinase inhibitor-like YbhB/YbcL family protein